MHGGQIVGGILRENDLRALGEIEFAVTPEMDRAGNPPALRHHDAASAGLLGGFERGLERGRTLRTVRFGAVIGDDKISGAYHSGQQQSRHHHTYRHFILLCFQMKVDYTKLTPDCANPDNRSGAILFR